VVVELTTNRTERLAPGTRLLAGDRELEVLSSGRHGARWIVRFAGVEDRDQADSLRGVVLRAEAIEDPDELWVHQLIGSVLRDTDGREQGRVVAVEANPASDLLVLEDGGLVPLRFVVSAGDGVVVADLPAGLLET
jgi:16S rRNA processing protein RimM